MMLEDWYGSHLLLLGYKLGFHQHGIAACTEASRIEVPHLSVVQPFSSQPASNGAIWISLQGSNLVSCGQEAVHCVQHCKTLLLHLDKSSPRRPLVLLQSGTGYKAWEANKVQLWIQAEPC